VRCSDYCLVDAHNNASNEIITLNLTVSFLHFETVRINSLQREQHK